MQSLKEWLAPFIDVANALAITINGFLIFNFAFAPWSWNPINDLLYVRSDGFILPANHISSALALPLIVLALQFMDWHRATHYLFVVYATASIHEFVLDAWNVPTMIVAHTLSYTITFRWFFWLGVFLTGGLLLASWKERKMLALITAFCAVYIGAWIVVATTFNIDTYTILAYTPGPAFYDPVPNLFEVSSWVAPSLFWLLPGGRRALLSGRVSPLKTVPS